MLNSHLRHKSFSMPLSIEIQVPSLNFPNNITTSRHRKFKSSKLKRLFKLFHSNQSTISKTSLVPTSKTINLKIHTMTTNSIKSSSINSITKIPTNPIYHKLSSSQLFNPMSPIIKTLKVQKQVPTKTQRKIKLPT